MSNATEFISSYNKIDARLRALYRGKGNLQFTDLVRRVAQCSATVKRYEDELVSFARLRNAIVHESTTERIIAEPCDEATALIAHIAALLSAPPRLSSLKERQPLCIDAEKTVSEAIVEISRSGYSNLPVYRKGALAGVLNNRGIIRDLGVALGRGESAEEFLQKPCGSVLREEDMTVYYKTLTEKDTVQDALDAFSQNRRLLAVLVFGESGAMNILTPSDIPRLLQILEN